jgi:hypothetical protein
MAPPYDVVAFTNNSFRRIAASHVPTVPAHGLKALRLAQNVRNNLSQTWAGQFRLRQEHGAPCLDHHFRIPQLMVVDRGREGN